MRDDSSLFLRGGVMFIFSSVSVKIVSPFLACVARSLIAVCLSYFLTLDYSLITHSFTLWIRAKRLIKAQNFVSLHIH